MENFSDLKVGDEVALIFHEHFGIDRGPSILKINKITEKMAWAEGGGMDISFRRSDGKIIKGGRVQRVTDKIRRRAASAEKRNELRDIVYHLDKVDELRRDQNHEFVDRLHAALAPFAEEIEQLYQLSQKRRY